MKSISRLTIVFCLLVLFYHVSSFAQSSPQADKFQAEGLTEPVAPKRGEPAVKVTFPYDDFHMLFDPPQVAGYFTPEGIGFSNEWAETKSHEDDGGDYGEVGFDRNAVMWIERQSPARKVVRFRGTLVDGEGTVAHTEVESNSPYGKGDWSDEWFYIYPDGVSVRVVKIYTGKTKDAVAFWGKPGYAAFWGVRGTIFETQETFIHGVPGLQPPDIIETEALTLITMDGRSKRISYKPYPHDISLFEPANIQMVNLKSKYHPFTIVTEGNVEIKPYYMPMDDHRNIDKTVFITWPRRGYFEDGDYTSALSHVIKWGWHEKTENTLVQIYLLGMIDDPTEKQRIDRLVKLARNWQYAPRLVLEGHSYVSEGYDIKQRAYVLSCKSAGQPSALEMELQASEKSPVVNPCFVVKGWGEVAAKMKIDGKPVEQGKDFRFGYEPQQACGPDLVVWINLDSTKPVKISLLPAGRN